MGSSTGTSVRTSSADAVVGVIRAPVLASLLSLNSVTVTQARTQAVYPYSAFCIRLPVHVDVAAAGAADRSCMTSRARRDSCPRSVRWTVSR